MTKSEARRLRLVRERQTSVAQDFDFLMIGVRKEAKRLVIPPASRLVWSDQENRMVWRRPEQ